MALWGLAKKAEPDLLITSSAEGITVAKRRTRPVTPRLSCKSTPLIFVNVDLGMISPLVSNYWEMPVHELVIKAQQKFTTNFPEASCAQFIGWYLRRRNAAKTYLTVQNLPVPCWNPHGDDANPPTGWLSEILADVSQWDPPAVVVRQDTFKITQGENVLWRSMFGDLFERMQTEGRDSTAYAEFLEILRKRSDDVV